MLSNSGYALIYESGGFVRATLFGLQGYFNLWGEARVGWKIFTCRRTAVRKIATLETVDKLDKLDDVCAICYHNLKPSTTNQVTTDHLLPLDVPYLSPSIQTILKTLTKT